MDKRSPLGEHEVFRRLPDGSRGSYGGDEFLFVEVSEAMSLRAALQVQSITARIRDLRLPAVRDIAPANASYLLRIDPEVAAPWDVMDAVAGCHDAVDHAVVPSIQTSIVEIPVLYDDPWTRETCLRFRAGHQSDTETDLEYTARVNGFAGTADLVRAHCSAPFIVTFPCFKPGNAESYQLVPQARQLEAPKYLSPRTQTPERAVAHGGCFTVVYPTDGVGGYQLLGIAAVPVVDLTQRRRGFEESMVLTPISTLIRFRAVDREEYDAIRIEVESGSYRFRRAPVTFSLAAFEADPEDYADTLTGLLA